MRGGESLKLSQVCKCREVAFLGLLGQGIEHSIVLMGIQGVGNVGKCCVHWLDSENLSF